VKLLILSDSLIVAFGGEILYRQKLPYVFK